MQKPVFVYSESSGLSNYGQLKAIIVWPERDLKAAPIILPLGGSLEQDEKIRQRLEEALG